MLSGPLWIGLRSRKSKDPTLIRTIFHYTVYLVSFAITFCKDDLLSIRRPWWWFVMAEVICYLLRIFVLQRIQGEKLIDTVTQAGINNAILCRWPGRFCIFRAFIGQSPDFSTLKIHDIELRFPATIGNENYMISIRGPGRGNINPGSTGELFKYLTFIISEV